MDEIDLDHATLDAALDHINAYWVQLERENKDDRHTLIGLPKPYLVPSIQPTHGFLYDEMYYWDNMFIMVGLLASGNVPMARNLIENEMALIDRFGMIPNASRLYMLSRSQPPTLTMQAFMIYEADNDVDFLGLVMERAKREYEEVWMSEKHPHSRLVYKGLSRYYDINYLHELAEAESGWDYTPRFNNKCLDYVPIDLNALLWKYETDFAAYAEIKGDLGEQKHWEEAALERRKMINKYLWHPVRKFYFDYNFKESSYSQIYSLASFVPMFVGMVSDKRAERLIYRLDLFETENGIAATPPEDGAHELKQWASPNGWAPLHYFVVKGLERYGQNERARAIARKWMRTNLMKFEETGQFNEKYNVVNVHSEPAEGVYPAQIGYGWTNGVFQAFAKDYA